jgi:hypothetical protein
VREASVEKVVEDEVMTRIGQVAMLLHAGDREEARNRFTALWEELGEDGDPLHRCTVAHFMADTQDDPEAELDWDLRALYAADHAALAARGFFPSLHLNLAADYWKVGENRMARSYLGRAREAATVLGDDAYADGVRAAIGRMELRLDASDQLP